MHEIRCKVRGVSYFFLKYIIEVLTQIIGDLKVFT